MTTPYFDLVFDIPGTQVFTYRADEKGEAEPGKRAMVPFGHRDILGYIISARQELPAGVSESSIKTIRRLVDKAAIFDNEDISLAEWIAGYYFCGLGQALAAMIPSGKRTGEYPALINGIDEISSSSPPPSTEQQNAIDTISKAAEQEKDNKSPPLFYLYGITGSGKTEVFLRTAEYMLNKGKTVIYLVPEISLTHQTADAIGRRFRQAAVIHSGMTPAARLGEWMRIRRGETRIIVGPRSAIFTPMRNLGLIIIDEEQDSSYKSGNTPRYHARQLAMHRASVEGAVLVMGSATPSAEAWKLMQDGVIKKLVLTKRLSGGTIPQIVPVNLANTNGCLSTLLKEEIRLTARMKRQTILFLNRRGFAYFYRCSSCGYELKCRHCSVSLTWHKNRDRAICHYCGYRTSPPKSCPGCGSLEAGFHGFGTEMIEEEVRKIFPDLHISRVDADTAGKKGSLKQTLDSFRRGEIDILLGTQMVAKGLNFPGVRLVGVILADTGLHLPDFRAAERTFSLVVQVAGRSGRYFPDGKVIVQTLRPDDPAIVYSCALDVSGFYDAELAMRRVLSFPPYTRLIRFTFRSRDAGRADKAAARLDSIARPLLPPGTDALGPAECPLGIINKNHRRQLILRGASMNTLHSACRLILEKYEKAKDSRVYLEVDVDPVSLL